MANPLLIIRAVARGNFAGRFLEGTKLGQRFLNRALTKEYGTQIKVLENGIRKYEKVEGGYRKWTYLNDKHKCVLSNHYALNDISTETGGVVHKGTRIITWPEFSKHSVREHYFTDMAKTTVFAKGYVSGFGTVPVGTKVKTIAINRGNKEEFAVLCNQDGKKLATKSSKGVFKLLGLDKNVIQLKGDGIIHMNPPEVENFWG